MFFVSTAIGIFNVYVLQSQTVCYAHKKSRTHSQDKIKGKLTIECFQALWLTAMKK